MAAGKAFIQNAIVTGATGSIGREIVKGLLGIKGLHVICPVRSVSRATEILGAAQADKLSYEVCDLASRSSIANFCSTVGSKYGGKVHLLINNAAVVPGERLLDTDGLHEQQYSVNILSYVRMMKGLRPYLKAAAEECQHSLARIVNVASNYAGGLDMGDLEFTSRPYDPNQAYRQSKQANRMLTAAAAPHFIGDHIVINACHPGVVESTLLHGLGFSGFESASKGAETPLYVALDPSISSGGKTGRYFDKRQQKPCSFASHPAVSELWQLVDSQA